MQKLNALWSDHICEKGDARNVASGVTKARNKAQLNGVTAKLEHDGNCLRRRYRRKRYDGATPATMTATFCLIKSAVKEGNLSS